MKDLSVYIHIPFCKQKCKYCDFCSFCADENMQKEYFSHLKNEIQNKSIEFNDYVVKTIYFGGGTPSSVDERFILSALDTIRKSFKVSENCETTIECNPCSTNEKKLKAYLNAGCNRISFGVQSFDDKVLSAIGRLHTGKEAEYAIIMAKKVGFKNISCDLIIGLPFQTEETLLSDIRKLNDLKVVHISTYMLQLEEGTPLFEEVKNGIIKVADEEKQVKLYEKAVKLMSECGFEQYEVSNFAKNKCFSQHNLAYWRRKEYLGFGLSAHSFVCEKRFANSKNIKEYFQGKNIFEEILTKNEMLTETIMLGLRCSEGFSLEKVKSYGKDLTKDKNFNDLAKNGYIFVDGDRVKLNPKFYAINNEIILKLI